MVAECTPRVQSAIQAALGRDLDARELKEVFKRADNFIRKGTEAGKDTATIEAELIAYAQEVIVATVIQKNNAARNALHVAKMYDTLTTVFGERPDVGIETILMGLQRDVLGSRDFLGERIMTKQDVTAYAFTSELERAKLHKLFRNASKTGLDLDIHRAMDQLHKDTPNLDGIVPEAVEIARIIDKHNEQLRVEGNHFGAHTRKGPGFVTSRVHDTHYLSKDPEGWVDFMMEHLDLERSLPDMDATASAKQILINEHSQLASGVHVRYRDSLDVTGFKGFQNTAKSLSHERIFHFKNPEAEAEYLKRFGPGDLATAVINGFTNKARDVAIIQNFGPNARANLDRTIDLLIKKHNGDQTMLNLLGVAQNEVDEKWWPTLSGSAAIPGIAKANQIASTVDHTVRSINRLSLLPFLVASQVPDIAIRASTVSREGRGFLTGIGESVHGLLFGVPDDVRVEVLSTLGVAVDGAIASVAGRLDANTRSAGKLASMEQTMYKYTGSQPWTDRMRATFAATDSHNMALRAAKDWDDLDPDYQRILRQQGILPEEWAMVQHTRQEMGDGRSYVVPERAMDMDESIITAELARIGLKPTKRRIYDFRVELRDKLRGYFHDRGDEAVLSPDMKTRATVTQGAQQGSGKRVFLNQMFALKTFPIVVVQRVLGAETLGRSTDLNATALTGLRLFATNGSAFKGVVQMVAVGTALGYVSMMLKDLSKGKKPRDPLDPKVMMAAMAQGGGIGIYFDFLFGDMKNRYGNNVLTSAMGPGVQDFIDFADLIAHLKQGDPKADKAFRFLMNNLPWFGTGPLRTALDYAIVNTMAESLSPGYLRRSEARLKENMDQDHFFPPSQVGPAFGLLEN